MPEELSMVLVDHKFIRMSDGVELHTHINESGQKKWLVALHGLGEHMRRHVYLKEAFQQDFNIFQFDLRGHGRSQGEKAYIENFDRYILDLQDILEYLRLEYDMKEFVLFGHSMGALIVSLFLQQNFKNSPYPERAFLSAPPVMVGGIGGPLFKYLPLSISRTLQNLPITFKLSGLVDLNYLSHNAKIKDEYLKDELNCLEIHSSLVFKLIHNAKKVYSRPLRAQCPVHVAAGSGDKVIDFDTLFNYFNFVEKGCDLKIIDDGYHELHHEISKYRIAYFEFLKTSLRKSAYHQN